tara:strand:- start:42591 stop:43826 length:1236 start_codon:yes stop_codon:yes gene_type:complete
MKYKQFNIIVMMIFSSCLLSLDTHAQQLEVLIQEALANNPEIQKFELRYGIASEKVNEANTLPNTEFSAGYFVSEPETRTGPQRFKLSAKQLFPWFGTITARENYASSLADANYEDIVIAKRKLMVSVAQSYYNLYTLKAKQQVLDENINLLKTYETLALTAVETGKASAVDVLRLQMRQNETAQSLQVLEQQYIAEQTVLNKLLNRNKNETITVMSNLMLPADDKLLLEEDFILHPELVKYDKLYQSIEQSELLNQKENKPMVGFGVDYIAVSEMSNPMLSDNGKDVLMPMVSVSIPLFNKKYKSQTKQNQLLQQELIMQKQERLNLLETQLSKAITTRNAAKISYDTQVKNLQQAKNAEEILVRSYETGTIDFNDVLDIQELQLKFQINQIEALRSYFVQTTLINYLTN